MRWRRLILPFVAVLIAVVMVFAMVINLEVPATSYAATVLDVDVEFVRAVPGAAELKQFAPESTRYAAEDQATRSVGVRCICPRCSFTGTSTWLDNVLHEHTGATGYHKARIGGQGVGVHAVPVPRGIGVENDDRTNCANAAPSTACPQVDVQG